MSDRWGVVGFIRKYWVYCSSITVQISGGNVRLLDWRMVQTFKNVLDKGQNKRRD